MPQTVRLFDIMGATVGPDEHQRGTAGVRTEIGKMGEPRTYPEGYFLGLWMAIFVPIGAALGLLMSDGGGMLAVGVGAGVGVGVAVGAGIEARYREKGLIRNLSPEEGKRRTRRVLMSVGALVAGLVVLVVVFLTR